jgi:hypothetical protein
MRRKEASSDSVSSAAFDRGGFEGGSINPPKDVEEECEQAIFFLSKYAT